MRAMNLAGQRYGRLVAVQQVPRETKKNKSAIWKCRCDCGKTAHIPARSLRSKTRVTQSCGCLQKAVRERNLGTDKMRWTDAERDAAELLYGDHKSEWRRHVSEYPALDNRTLESLSSYIKNFLSTAAKGPVIKAKVNPGGWPTPGVLVNGRFIGERLFEISANATLNHGSPIGELRRPDARSGSGCSALWTSEAA